MSCYFCFLSNLLVKEEYKNVFRILQCNLNNSIDDDISFIQNQLNHVHDKDILYFSLILSDIINIIHVMTKETLENKLLFIQLLHDIVIYIKGLNCNYIELVTENKSINGGEDQSLESHTINEEPPQTNTDDIPETHTDIEETLETSYEERVATLTNNNEIPENHDNSEDHAHQLDDGNMSDESEGTMDKFYFLCPCLTDYNDYNMATCQCRNSLYELIISPVLSDLYSCHLKESVVLNTIYSLMSNCYILSNLSLLFAVICLFELRICRRGLFSWFTEGLPTDLIPLSGIVFDPIWPWAIHLNDRRKRSIAIIKHFESIFTDQLIPNINGFEVSGDEKLNRLICQLESRYFFNLGNADDSVLYWNFPYGPYHKWYPLQNTIQNNLSFEANDTDFKSIYMTNSEKWHDTHQKCNTPVNDSFNLLTKNSKNLFNENFILYSIYLILSTLCMSISTYKTPVYIEKLDIITWSWNITANVVRNFILSMKCLICPLERKMVYNDLLSVFSDEYNGLWIRDLFNVLNNIDIDYVVGQRENPEVLKQSLQYLISITKSLLSQSILYCARRQYNLNISISEIVNKECLFTSEYPLYTFSIVNRYHFLPRIYSNLEETSEYTFVESENPLEEFISIITRNKSANLSIMSWPDIIHEMFIEEPDLSKLKYYVNLAAL